MKRISLLLLAIITLAACEKQLPPARNDLQISRQSTGRFEVRMDSEFYDDLAFNDKRGIYVITDRDTGKEYIGVSGIGIVEKATTSAGKSNMQIEQ